MTTGQQQATVQRTQTCQQDYTLVLDQRIQPVHHNQLLKLKANRGGNMELSTSPENNTGIHNANEDELKCRQQLNVPNATR